MSRFVRAAAVTLVVALLQLVLLESGYACLAMPAGPGDVAMAGMSMPAEGESPSNPTDAGEDQAPCEFPWAPNGCETMAPCAPAAVTTVATQPAPDSRLEDGPLTLVELTPSSPSRAPELPPPRA